MSLLKTILCISFLLVLPGLLTAADTGTGKLGVVKKSQLPDDENGNVLRRMQSSGFDFTKPHDVEFFAVFRTEAMADSVARQYVADSKAGDKIKWIDTKPAKRGAWSCAL